MKNIIPIIMIALTLHSIGFACDDCSLSLVEVSCQHTQSNHEHHEHDEDSDCSSNDPCTNSLCSLCGHALPQNTYTGVLQLKSSIPHKEKASYSFLFVKELERPPQA